MLVWQPPSARTLRDMTPGSAGGRLPQTRRGVETRTALIAAAREIFDRHGFLGARVITDIAQAAGTATGSFYTYFTSKEEIFSAVMDEVGEEMLHPNLEDAPLGDGHRRVDRGRPTAPISTRIAETPGLMAVLEQVSTVNDEFRELRSRRGAAFTRRNARSIRRLQADGLADPGLDPLIAARALSGMVSRLAYQAFILNQRMPFEQLVSTSTRLWVNALKIPTADS